MRRFIAVVATFGFFACGGVPLTPQTACEEQVGAQCEKMWTCPKAALKIGSDLESCKTQFKAFCALSTTCKDGKTFDAMNASACEPAIKAQTCEEFVADAPTSCKNQCK